MPIKINPIDPSVYPKIKTKEQIDVALQMLLQTKIVEPSHGIVKELYFQHLNHLSLPVFESSVQMLEEFSVFRSRRIGRSEDITNLMTFGSPPASKDVNRIGRANWPQHPVFYGADTPITTFNESKNLGVGNDLYVAKYKFDFSSLPSDRKIPLVTLIFGDVPAENPWRSLLNDFKHHLFPVERRDLQESFSYLNEKLSDLFTTPNAAHYPLTAFIAHTYLHNEANDDQTVHFPILVYPSIETKKRNCNFAIHPGFERAFLRLENVFHVVINDYRSDDFGVNVIKIGLPSTQNKIEWFELDVDTRGLTFTVDKMICSGCGLEIPKESYEGLAFSYGGEKISLSELVSNLVGKQFHKVVRLSQDNMDQLNLPETAQCSLMLNPGPDCYFELNGIRHTHPAFVVDLQYPLKYRRCIQ